jgi:hypothetical protein
VDIKCNFLATNIKRIWNDRLFSSFKINKPKLSVSTCYGCFSGIIESLCTTVIFLSVSSVYMAIRLIMVRTAIVFSNFPVIISYIVLYIAYALKLSCTLGNQASNHSTTLSQEEKC